MKQPTVLIAQTKNDFSNIFSQRDLKHRMYQSWLRKVDRCIAISEELRDEMMACGIPDSRIVRIPNVVNSARFCVPSSAHRQILRSKFSAEKEEVVFLFLGRLVERKGADVLLKAWQKQSAGTLWIVGDGPEKNALQKQADELKLRSVVFFGKTDTPLDFYQAADVFVLPSRSEGLPCVALEAMSCGLPCIATTIGGIVDQIENDREGLLVRSDDDEALALAIQRMAAESESRVRWSKQALNTIEQRYEISKAAEQYHQLYKVIVQE